MNKLPSRSQALDVLRGLTVALMIMVNTPGSPEKTYAPFLHADWHGLTLTDLVFPTFLFVVGAALSFTLEKYQALTEAEMLKKIFVRTGLIFLSGYLLYWFPFFEIDSGGQLALLPMATTRVMGVLQRIALGYCAAALILHYWGTRGAAWFSVLTLLAYWGILVGFGDESLSGNAVRKLDLALLGEGHLYVEDGIAFDPEGILSTLPSIFNVIAGYFAGRFLRALGPTYEAVAKLFLAGAACIVIALIWGSFLPINKKLWTSSYALCAVGIDLCLLGALAYWIDLLGRRRLVYFFEVFGRNTLFIFLLSECVMIACELIRVGRTPLTEWVQMHVFQSWAGLRNGSLLFSFAFMIWCWLIAYCLDRRRIYIKL